MKNVDDSQTKRPFRVPEGYFEQLKNDIIRRVVPSEDGSKVVAIESRNTYLRPLIGVAASVCVAIFGVSVYMHNAGAGAVADDPATTSELLFASDDAEDYIMLDNEDIYRYLSGIE